MIQAQTPSIAAYRDPSMAATVTKRVPLFYTEGSNPVIDRPAHVRAGSGLTWFGDRIAVIQDDALFIALIDPVTHRVEALPLPAGRGGVWLFDEQRANKHDKFDLEACTGVPSPQGEMLLVFGSGSTEQRESIAMIQHSGAVELYHAHRLYCQLRAEKAFSGSELNLEGAVFIDGWIRLFNRGNGGHRGSQLPVNATCDIRWQALESYLRRPDIDAVPAISRVTRYDLGQLHGQRLSFTDAAATDAGILYLAAAEDSTDAVTDGRVSGSAIGIIAASGKVRWTELRNPDGTLSQIKAEGLCTEPGSEGRLYLVIDMDDPTLPSELCEVAIAGI